MRGLWGRYVAAFTTHRIAAITLSVIGLLFVLGVIGAASNGGTKTVAGPTVQVTTTATATKNMPVPGETATVTATVVKTSTLPAPPAVTVTEPPPPPKDAFGGDGTFLVGSEVQPGTYESPGPAAGGIGECSYSVNRQGSGIDSIITNGNSAGQTVVQVPAGAFSVFTQGCQPFHKA